MAETRELFNILSDGSDEGIEYKGKAPGGAQSTDEQAPVLPAIDSSGNLQNIEQRDAGEAVAGVGGLPSLAFQDSSGNFVYPQLNSDGEVPVGEAGTKQFDSDVATIAALNTEQDVASVTLAVDDVVSVNCIMVSSFQPTLFICYLNDNGARTELTRTLVGAGSYSSNSCGLDIPATAGSTGAQAIEIRATQLRGALTDAHAMVSIKNLG